MDDVSLSRSSDQPTIGGPRSLGQLFGEVSRELGELVRHEVELAKSELREETAEAERVDVRFGVAVAAGAMSLLFVSLAVVWGLSEIMPAALAFLVVAGAYAGVTAYLVRRNQQASPTAGERSSDGEDTGNGRIELVE